MRRTARCLLLFPVLLFVAPDAAESRSRRGTVKSTLREQASAGGSDVCFRVTPRTLLRPRRGKRDIVALVDDFQQVTAGLPSR